MDDVKLTKIADIRRVVDLTKWLRYALPFTIIPTYYQDGWAMALALGCIGSWVHVSNMLARLLLREMTHDG